MPRVTCTESFLLLFVLAALAFAIYFVVTRAKSYKGRRVQPRSTARQTRSRKPVVRRTPPPRPVAPEWAISPMPTGTARSDFATV